MLLVAFTLFAAPVPQAAAQEPVRPAPEELWRQFPLEDPQPNQETPAEANPAPVSPPTSRSTGDEGRDQTVQIAAIVLTMALVLILTTGMLAYATQGRLELPGLTLRRWFRRTGDALPAARTDQGQHGIASRLRRRLAVAAAPPKRQTRARVSTLREHTASPDTPSAETGLATLTERLDTSTRSRESSANDELEKLKAKLDVAPASTGTPADDQLEILKAKRSERAPVDAEGPHEVETLKAKLARGAVAETATRNVKKAKLDLADEPAEAEAPVSVYADGSGGGAGERDARRAADSLARTNTGR